LRQRSDLATFQFIDLDLRDPGNETKMIVVALVPLLASAGIYHASWFQSGSSPTKRAGLIAVMVRISSTVNS
jgi:hypothetical protein